MRGEPGIGKTALLRAIASRASESGWLVASATCHSRQENIPFSAARKLVRALFQALRSRSENYVVGLQALFDDRGEPLDPVRALVRLLEGASLDYCVLLTIDDSQWADRDSSAALRDVLQNLIDCAVVVQMGKRTGDARGEGITPDSVIELEPLSDPTAASIVISLASDVDPRVANEIVRHARGNPFDLVALTQLVVEDGVFKEESVLLSRRSLIAKQLREMPDQTREFLQICSLVGERVDHALLYHIWSDADRLNLLIQSVTSRYMSPSQSALHFTHALIADAVRQTIAMPIPYRRKIVDAIRKLDRPRPEDFEMLAEQLAACGEHDEAFRVLARLADDAAERHDSLLIVSASAQALRYARPSLESEPLFYKKYAEALSDLNRSNETIELLERVLHEAEKNGQPLSGELVYRLVLALVNTRRDPAARIAYAKYADKIADPVEAAYLSGAAALFSVVDGDVDALAALEQNIRQSPDAIPQPVRFLVFLQKALLFAERDGGYLTAMSALDEARSVADSLDMPQATRFRERLALASTVVGLNEFGARTTIVANDSDSSSRDGIVAAAWQLRYLALRHFLEGNFEAADRVVARALGHDGVAVDRAWMLSIAAAMAALRADPTPYEPLIEGAIRPFIQGNSDDAAQLALWWVSRLARTDQQRARAILGRVNKTLDRPARYHMYTPKIAFAIAARAVGDESMLLKIASEHAPPGLSPWHAGHYRAAQCLASALVGKRFDDLKQTLDECRRLGLSLYADLASYASRRDGESRARLAASNIVWNMGAAGTGTASPLRPTARELEVAELVAAGKSNSEIADALVLSHRTVEAHISNLFGKLGVSSRTQIAAWYLRR